MYTPIHTKNTPKTPSIPPPPRQKKHTHTQDSSGSTAVVALVTPSLLAVANLGDSRAILLSSSNDDGSEGGIRGEGEGGLLVATPLSFDHKPELPAERARVERAGAFVDIR